MMRWSEFADKECVNVMNGEKLGTFSQADLVIEPETGKITAILLPVGSSFLKRRSTEMEVKWQMIRKVGPEVVIIDSSVTQHR